MSSSTASTAAVIYTRVSHANRSISVRDQERECRAVCERNGWPVRATFCDDGISASRYGKARPQWEAMRAELQPGDVLVVWEASRATRDLGEFVRLRDLCAEREVLFSFAGEVLDLSQGGDRFSGGLKILLAEQESEQLKERVRRGKRAAAADGRPSGPPPWGYRVKEVDGIRVPGVWEHDPVEAPRVREAVKRFLRGESQYSILRWLESTEGRTFSSPSNLRRAVSNPALAGFRVHQGQVVPDVRGTWPPLISDDDHRKLVNFFKARQREYGHVNRPGPEPIHLLSGIAVCSVCEQPLRMKQWNDGSRSPSYVCNLGHSCRVARKMDEAVEKELFALLSRIDPSRYRQTDDPEAQRARDEIAEIEETLAEWIAAAGRREVTPAAFAAIEKDLRNRIAVLQPKTLGRSRLPGKLDLEQIPKRWDRLTMRQKRDIIRAFVTVTVVPAGKRGGRDGKLLIEPVDLDN